jgi:feruloyl esterase
VSNRTFDLETDRDQTLDAAAIVNATVPDLNRFRQAGGKMILYQGWVDQDINPLGTIEYHDQVYETTGDKGNVNDF